MSAIKMRNHGLVVFFYSQLIYEVLPVGCVSTTEVVVSGF